MSTQGTCTKLSDSPSWLQDTLKAWRAHFLLNSLAPSSRLSYDAALHSYIHFCNIHGFPLNPTPDTLSFYLTFASFYVKPNTLTTYLSGICSQLETHYSTCHTARHSFLVARTLAGI